MHKRSEETAMKRINGFLVPKSAITPMARFEALQGCWEEPYDALNKLDMTCYLVECEREIYLSITLYPDMAPSSSGLAL